MSSPLDWSVSFEFRAETLKHFNPLPHVLQLLLEVHDLRARGGALYTVLAELYSNALEHGVIGLDSTMKSDAAGFARYYQERVSRLQALRDGYVRLHLDLAPHGAGGRLLVRVEDSGEGFDVERALNAVERQERLCGRGLRLIRELQAGDAQALRHTAHSFKGGSSNMGAVLLAGYCKELEESARRGDLQRAPALIEQMEREFAIVRILFKQERQRYR